MTPPPHAATEARTSIDCAAIDSDAERNAPMRGLNILLVDDDAMIGEVLAEMLTDLGHRICAIAATEAEAVSGAMRCKPDLMIVDARLSGGSGVAAVERILSVNPIPYLFMSGAGVEAGRPGAIVLSKPFREADLVGAIQRALVAFVGSESLCSPIRA